MLLVYLMVRGESPYNASNHTPVLPAAWFPIAIGFFGPLGWIGESIAFCTVLFLSIGVNYIQDGSLLDWLIINTLELCAIGFLSQGKSKSFHVAVAATWLVLRLYLQFGSFFLKYPTN